MSQLFLDFSLHGEEGRKPDKKKGLTDKVCKARYSKDHSGEAVEEHIKDYTMSKIDKADKRSLQKKLAASERRVHDLEERLVSIQAESDEKVRNLTNKLNEEMAKMSSMIQQSCIWMMVSSPSAIISAKCRCVR